MLQLATFHPPHRHYFKFLKFQVASPEIAMIKVVAPAMAQNVTDRAIQVTGWRAVVMGLT
jgi:alkylation response protein AidB-like acyl-CoA dehydrogenase